MLRSGLIVCCLLAFVPSSVEARRVQIEADASAVSFTVHGPAVLQLGRSNVRLEAGPTRIELARSRSGWRVSVGGSPARRVARLDVGVVRGRVTQRLSGAGPLRLLGARLLAKSIHPGWLQGPLVRQGAWMRGMPAAALWRLAEVDRRHRASWSRRAVGATLALQGAENEDTHDVGFVYGEGAAYGYDRFCGGVPVSHGQVDCNAMLASATAAADRLVAMIRANAPSPLLPNHLAGCPDCPPGAREVIIDSMMNIGLLPWAERRAGRTGYGRLALLHARAVASALIRPDGCTAQAVFVEHGTGRLFGTHTHQGISAGSTWARGQAWALLGFARLARATGDVWARVVTRRLARCWFAKATPGRLVRFDLDARAGPPDSSAQAVAAAGFATLAHADRARRTHWTRAARRELAVVERLISRQLPLGRLGRQTYVAGGSTFDEDVELPIGQLYVLDARARLRETGFVHPAWPVAARR